MPTNTTTYSFQKPVVGADEDDWGGYLNGNWDSVDDLLDGTTPVTGIDINSGTLDGVTIGGTTAGAGTFTTLTANTSITGTLATAAQTNITSVGTLTGLTVSGSTSLAGASTSADITFGDNDKAIFGAGSDLQIYHNGTDSVISENTAGNLLIQGDNLYLQNPAGSSTYIRAKNGLEVDLRYNGSVKLATTSTGIDVTGTVTADGLISNLNVNSTTVPTTRSSYQIAVEVDGAHTGDYVGGIAFGDQALATAQAAILVADRGASAATGLAFATGNSAALTQRMRIDDIGDISFYEDTGTTAKFFWDASAESLGIGTTSPAGGIDATTASSDAYFFRGSHATTTNFHITNTNATSGNTANLYLAPANGVAGSYISSIAIEDFSVSANRTADLAFYTRKDGTFGERMRIDSSGNVGIGTTSPAYQLDVQGAGNSRIRVKNTSVTGEAQFHHDGNGDLYIKNSVSGRNQVFFNDGAERMRIDSSGNLLVGKTSATGFGSTAGFQVLSDGRILSTVSGDQPLAVSRTSSDGNIAEFYKDSTLVGSIGTNGGRVVIGHDDAGLKFNGQFDTIHPFNITTNSNSDAVVSLGTGSQRFKDLYLSGGIEIENGAGNVGVGLQALNSNTASYNTAFGYKAGYTGTTAARNTLIGFNAGYSLTSGSQNTIVGANDAAGYGSGYFITSGSKNTILGAFDGNQGGLDIRTSSNNIVLSDGDGNPRAWCQSTGAWRFGTSANDAAQGNFLLADGGWAYWQNAQGTYASLTLKKNGTNGSNAVDYFQARNTINTLHMVIEGDGDVKNLNNSYGATSDQKLKENIVDSGSQWDDIKAVRVRKYSFIADDLDAPNQLGVIAQELEASGMSGLVGQRADTDEDGNDLGTVTKDVKYSILYMKAIKALQEAMDRIETLEAKVTALENA